MPQQRANAPASPVKLSFKEKLTGRGFSSDAIQKKLKVRDLVQPWVFSLADGSCALVIYEIDALD